MEVGLRKIHNDVAVGGCFQEIRLLEVGVQFDLLELLRLLEEVVNQLYRLEMGLLDDDCDALAFWEVDQLSEALIDINAVLGKCIESAIVDVD